MDTPDTPQRICLFCTLMQALGRILAVLFLPRVFAFVSALGLLGLMAMSASDRIDSTRVAAVAAASAPATAPASAATPVPAATSAPAASAPDAAASDNLLRFAIITPLPSGRVGEPWKSRQMLELGQPPYAMSFVSARPAWISEYAAGTLGGTPDKEGLYVFTLRGASKNDADQLIEQSFSIRVLPRRSAIIKPVAVAAVASAPAGPSPLKTERYTPQTFRLETIDISTDPPAEFSPVPDALPSAPNKPKLDPPDLAAWQKMLEPLVGVDYPSEAQFRSALKLVHCHAYQTLLDEQKNKPTSGKSAAGLSSVAIGTALSELAASKCKAPDGPVPASGAGTHIDPAEGCVVGLLAPLTTFETLMPPAVRECLVERAQRHHKLDDLLPTHWEAKAGCACLPMSDPKNPDEVYGFLNYWGTAAQQAAWEQLKTKAAVEAKAAGQEPQRPERKRQSVPLDYSLYSRLSFMGAVLNDNGSYVFDAAVMAQGKRLAAVARRHRTETDLVIYRNDWRILANENWQPSLEKSAQPPQDVGSALTAAVTGAQATTAGQSVKRDALRATDRIDQAAAEAVDLLDTAATHKSGKMLEALMPRFWREGQWVFTGLTVFFDNPPPVGTPEGKRYADFLRSFMAKVIEKMQAKGRSYRLNLVMPADQISEAGAYQFRNLLSWVQSAEPPDTSSPGGKKNDVGYEGSTDIAVRYIVLMPDPATDAKKALRARFDAATSVHGEGRVALLRRTLPMLQRPPAVRQPPWLEHTRDAQWSDDLAYAKWSFNGVALWEAPDATESDQWLQEPLRMVFRPDQGTDGQSASLLQWLADTVCLQRMACRLLWMATVLFGAIAILLWMVNCAVRRWGEWYQRFLQVGSLWFVGLTSAMVVYDPVVVQMAGNYWLQWLLAIVMLTTVFIVKVNPKGETP
ncbi:MAG: hypothetical protein AB3X44_10230 [Leptothrix sp. (in: b-proteobacteria)]